MTTQNLSVSVVTGRDSRGNPSGFISFPIGLPSGFSGGGGSIPNPLPVINGGTSSTIPLTNGKFMISSADKIIEGQDFSNPSFQTLNLTNLPTENSNYSDNMLYFNPTLGIVYNGLNYDNLVKLRNTSTGNLLAFDNFTNKIGQTGMINVDSVMNTVFIGNPGGQVFSIPQFNAPDILVDDTLQVQGTTILNGSLNIPNLGAGVTGSALYFNTTTKQVTYGSAGGISIVSGEGNMATTDGVNIFNSAVIGSSPGALSIKGSATTYNAGTLTLQNVLDDGSGLSYFNGLTTMNQGIVINNGGIVSGGLAIDDIGITNSLTVGGFCNFNFGVAINLNGLSVIGSTITDNLYVSAIAQLSAGLTVTGGSTSVTALTSSGSITADTLKSNGLSTINSLLTQTSSVDMKSLTQLSTPNVLYYNNTTGRVTWNTAPSGVTIGSGEGAVLTTPGSNGVNQSAVIATIANPNTLIVLGGISTFNQLTTSLQNILDDGSGNTSIAGNLNSSKTATDSKTSYTSTGITQIIPSAGATTMIVKLWGAGGSSGGVIGNTSPNSYGGGGGFSKSTIPVNSGSTYWLVLGSATPSTIIGSGANGGSPSAPLTPSGNGGGATGLYELRNGIYTPLVIAGGGGGGGANPHGTTEQGGSGGSGGVNGNDSQSGINIGGAAGGGGVGGTGGVSGSGNDGTTGNNMSGSITSLTAPSAGTSGYGGAGGSNTSVSGSGSGGGGYGGGGGGSAYDGSNNAYGGGGGGGNLGTSVESGINNLPGGTTDPDYISPRGQGGAQVSGAGTVPGLAGNDGLAVISFENYSLTAFTTGKVLAPKGVQQSNYVNAVIPTFTLANGASAYMTSTVNSSRGISAFISGGTRGFQLGPAGMYEIEFQISTTAAIIGTTTNLLNLFCQASTTTGGFPGSLTHNKKLSYYFSDTFSCKTTVYCPVDGMYLAAMITNNTGSSITTTSTTSDNYLNITLINAT